jgi:ATP-binding cassette subfamily B protein
MLRSDASWRPVNLIVFGLSIFREAITLIAMFGILAKYNWYLSLALLIVLIPQSITYYRIQQDAFETMVERSKNARKLNYYSGLLLDRKDAKEARLFNMFTPIIKRYTELFNETQSTVNIVRKRQAMIGSLYLALVVLVSAYGFYWFIQSVIAGKNGIGVLMLYISVIAYISQSMARIVEDSSLLYDSLLWVDKYYKFIDFTDEIREGNQKFPTQFTKIVVDNLSFKYPFSNKIVLKNISFSVNQGEKIAIVGENGSGKSTLVKLLLRFYDYSQGAILINDTPLHELNISDYRTHISATFQDFSQFKLSLADNVSSAHEYVEEEVKAALDVVGMREFYQQTDVSLQTIMSKEFMDGTDASGGQWQRIALARDLYANGEIEFLDEPTSALDARSEADIYERFLLHNANKTIFFVTHRLSSVKFADKVLFLDEGSVAGFATHEQLMENNQKYAEMYNIQKDAYL